MLVGKYEGSYGVQQACKSGKSRIGQKVLPAFSTQKFVLFDALTTMSPLKQTEAQQFQKASSPTKPNTPHLTPFSLKTPEPTLPLMHTHSPFISHYS